MLARHAIVRLLPAVLLALFIAPAARAQSCAGDLNGDYLVNGADIGILLNSWGQCTDGNYGCLGDLNRDGTVNGADLGLLVGAWGICPPVNGVPVWATLIDFDPDPAIVLDPAQRLRIRATGLAWRVRDTATQIEMLLVPPGTFQMGCIMGSNQDGCFSLEQPVHEVTLTNAFYLGRYEVTQSQWVARMGSNPSRFQGQSDSAIRPVEQVSWNAVEGYLSATGFRLPTEAEWEYACRAGTQTPFHSGPGFPNGTTDNNLVSQIAWFYCNDGCTTKPVGGKAANAFGFYDMLGNVWEWVNDWYGRYTSAAQTDPTGPASASYRVIRGGSWDSDAINARSSTRSQDSPRYANSTFGFRVARTP